MLVTLRWGQRDAIESCICVSAGDACRAFCLLHPPSQNCSSFSKPSSSSASILSLASRAPACESVLSCKHNGNVGDEVVNPSSRAIFGEVQPRLSPSRVWRGALVARDKFELHFCTRDYLIVSLMCMTM